MVIERLGYTLWGSRNRRSTLSGTPLDTPEFMAGTACFAKPEQSVEAAASSRAEKELLDMARAD